MWRDSQFSQDGHVLHGCFSTCRPKLMSAFQIRPIQLENVMHFPEYLCRELMNRNGIKCCGDGSTCWRNDLKDVKIKVSNGEAIELSEDVISSIVKRKQNSVTFMLTW